MLHRFYDNEKKRYCTEEEANFLKVMPDGTVSRIKHDVCHIPTEMGNNTYSNILFGYSDNKQEIGVVCFVIPAPEISVEWGMDSNGLRFFINDIIQNSESEKGVIVQMPDMGLRAQLLDDFLNKFPGKNYISYRSYIEVTGNAHEVTND